MLTSILRCETSSAEINLVPKPPFCINRAEAEGVVECFEENLACHNALESMAKEQSSQWSIFIYSFLGGVISGVVLDHQIRH